MHGHAALRAVLTACPRRSYPGPWSRAVARRHLVGPPPGSAAGSGAQPLWPGGASVSGGRFTPKGGFPCLYLAENPISALREVEVIFAGPDGTLMRVLYEPYVVFAVAGVAAEMVDLTEPGVQTDLGTNDTELRGPWLRAQSRYLTGKVPCRRRRGSVRWRMTSSPSRGFDTREPKTTG
ncbi:MAG TPA: RES domain-containing protein [Gemmatimonadales bacterium]